MVKGVSIVDIIARKLEYYRRVAGLTQLELAEEIGESPTMIADFENGRELPTFETVVRFAHIFGVTTDQLLGHQVLG